MIINLNKQVKATVVAGENNSVTVSIGNGQPLVVGNKSFELAAIPSQTDLTRLQVGYVTGGQVTPLGENALSGGELGGLMDFRANSLDRAQNSLGRIAIGLAATFNAQHRLGQDDAGNMGGDFFTQAPAEVLKNQANSLGGTTASGMTLTSAAAWSVELNGTSVKVAYNGTDYVVTRLSDNNRTTISPFPQLVAQTIDGIDFQVSGAAAAGDNFLVRPTINGAAQFAVALQDRSKIAAGAPIVTSAPLTNTGSGKISLGSVDKTYLAPGNRLTAPVTLTYAGAGATLSGFPAGQNVTMTVNGVPTTYPAPAGAVPYTAGASYSFGGILVTMSGQPGNNDTFTVAPNSGGIGDNRNARLLGNLQSATILDGGSATYQSAYAELVSFVGNKTREAQVNGTASDALLAQASNAQQNVSGVNLDEEASNLLKYQQAYQAAGKVMQIASTMFDTLLSLGH